MMVKYIQDIKNAISHPSELSSVEQGYLHMNIAGNGLQEEIEHTSGKV
jgi:hypothetical protein